MNLLRKLFGIEHEGGRYRRRRNGKGYDQRYRADDYDERWDRHPGSIPAMPPDLICPKCRKSNPPGTPACKQCDTPLGGNR
ncbi:hypothetical protein BTHE68_60530 (plasmid) [Burkholderia sp. THE68]|uniref:hypothetical protein n=1 Tax=Burkholderia sp. THE68 TaxID=758782 RepID=UPI0013174DF1|nr:hypothetical protein [Burkholderia sp. THE68]BBU32319.1 hypothetical protein BTHE68_60530 [Burkholderia sp. THE68]